MTLHVRQTPAQPVAHHRFPASFDNVVMHAERHLVSGGSVWLHVHPEWELALVECDTGSTIVGGHAHVFHRLDFVLIPGGLPHRWLLGTSVQPSDAVFHIVAFTPESIGGTHLSRREYRSLRVLLQKASRGLRFSGDGISSAVIEMMGTINSVGLTRIAGALSLFDRLANDLKAVQLVTDTYERSPYMHEITTLERVVQNVLEHPQGRVTVATAAQSIHASAATLERMCSRITGSSFVTYVTARRIGQAAELLRTTSLTVADIADRVGFGNLSHFNRMFRRHVGMPPRNYRSDTG